MTSCRCGVTFDFSVETTCLRLDTFAADFLIEYAPTEGSLELGIVVSFPHDHSGCDLLDRHPSAGLIDDFFVVAERRHEPPWMARLVIAIGYIAAALVDEAPKETPSSNR